MTQIGHHRNGRSASSAAVSAGSPLRSRCSSVALTSRSMSKRTSSRRSARDTLVVDTINFKRETSFPNSGANLHLVEKFTRTDADTLMYEFTIDDPSVWTRPFTAVVPMRKSDQPIYEYACHEGNYAMASILAGARAAEKAAEAKASK